MLAIDAVSHDTQDEVKGGRMEMPARQASPPGDAGQWRHHSILPLGALPGAVPCARLHAIAVLWEWHMATLAHPAELVVSELVTNAIRASVKAQPAQGAPGMSGGIPAVELRLAGDGRHLLVEVSDHDPGPPVPAGVDPDRDGGRGLLLVTAVSDTWGYYYPAGDSPASDYPVGDTPASDYPASDNWASDYPAGDHWASDYIARDYPAGDYPAGGDWASDAGPEPGDPAAGRAAPYAAAPADVAAGRAGPFLAAPPVLPLGDPAPGKIVWALLSPR